MLCLGKLNQRLAVDDFHREEGLRAEPGLGGAGFVDLRDAGMVETTEGLEFLFEPAENTRQRLGLMIQICEAVEHAHQRGIIHRDLQSSCRTREGDSQQDFCSDLWRGRGGAGAGWWAHWHRKRSQRSQCSPEPVAVPMATTEKIPE